MDGGVWAEGSGQRGRAKGIRWNEQRAGEGAEERGWMEGVEGRRREDKTQSQN